MKNYYKDYPNKVELTGITFPLDGRVKNAEHFLIQQARISNPKGEYNDQYVNLLKSLIERQHWSILELVSVNMKLIMPLDVLGQFVRHKSWHITVLSRRYTEQKMEIFIPELRFRDPADRQNSIEAETDIDIQLMAEAEEEVAAHFEKVKKLYFEMLDKGIAKECARSVLPQTTLTSANVHVNIRDLMFYIKLRLGNGTQKEHTLLAQAMLDVIRPHFPNVVEAFGL
jgi:thymidylate synthase (FAD)